MRIRKVAFILPILMDTMCSALNGALFGGTAAYLLLSGYQESQDRPKTSIRLLLGSKLQFR